MTTSATSTISLRPLLPALCSSSNFVHASPSQVIDYANSSSVVAQLSEGLDAWLSHCKQIAEDVSGFFYALDQDCVTVAVHDDLICDIAASLRRLELESSFFSHFSTDEVRAVRRVLDSVVANNKNHTGISAASVKERLAKLDSDLQSLEAENKLLTRSRDLFQLLDSYCAPGTPWTLFTCDDTLPPLFCALRAIFVCCPLFGKTHPERFSVLVRCILQRVETLISKTVPPLLTPEAVSVARTGVEDAAAACLAAQTAAVCMQEQFYQLRISVAEAVSKEYTAQLYTGIDETSVFCNLDFYFDRCVIILHLLSVVKERKEELLLNGSLLERLLRQELLTRGVQHEDLIDAIRALVDAPSMRPKDIISRIERKSQDFVQMWKKREVARISSSDAAIAAATDAHGVSSSSSSSSRTSRVAEKNAAANGSWSLSHGDQQAAIASSAAGINTRPAYFTIVVVFPLPHLYIVGWPLKPKELERIAIAFQDALRARVTHTAASIRSNRLDMAAINTATSVLKAPYAKFRSASDDLADARFEAQERTFHTQSGPVGSSSSLVGHDGKLSLEAELMQLRRFHVAAAHHAHMLDVPDTNVEEDELQSHGLQAVLDCVEVLDGHASEMATTNAFTDQDGIHWSFFIFRHIPSLTKSKQQLFTSS